MERPQNSGTSDGELPQLKSQKTTVLDRGHGDGEHSHLTMLSSPVKSQRTVTNRGHDAEDADDEADGNYGEVKNLTTGGTIVEESGKKNSTKKTREEGDSSKISKETLDWTEDCNPAKHAEGCCTKEGASRD
ncbi:hypothetical protein EXN66_Car014194 [Channa argus]|uniref:Uncharacterized protein n=1 Tax=Channa argus TaxID=215402 RepID=A0A6G1Q858_CHAAH|nr:hypothetical protein EXN66_Car014194 [Channa argus]